MNQAYYVGMPVFIIDIQERGSIVDILIGDCVACVVKIDNRYASVHEDNLRIIH